MTAFFNLALDTLAPAGVLLKINDGAIYASSTAVTLKIATSDTITTGYTMKIYGDVKAGSNTVALTEALATWETYTTSKPITLLGSDGAKTVKIKIRDDVYNESTEITAAITLDTVIPIVTIIGPDVAKLSEQMGKDASTFSFTGNEKYVEYKVMVVPSNTSIHSAGTQIGTTFGSLNMNGTGGNYPAATAISCTIKGKDFSAAAGGSDGAYIVKVFIKDSANNWSA